MEANDRKAGNGVKVGGIVTGVIALIAVCFGMINNSVKPMAIQLEGLQRELGRVEDRGNIALRDHLGLGAHPEAHKELTRATEKFAEVETQFQWMKETTMLSVASLEHRIETLENELKEHNNLAEKIKHLERATYGK